MKQYIVIDYFCGYVNIVTNENGEEIIFDSFEEAQKEADECRNARVVQLW